MKILFVCLGNICRSPMARAMFDYKISVRQLKNISSDSCGTAGYHVGDSAYHLTISTLNNHNIPISHRARQFSLSDFKTFDYIIAMDRNNLYDLQTLKKSGISSTVCLMRDYDSQADSKDVPDPYYGTQKDFENVFRILDRCLNAFLYDLARKHSL